MQKVIYNRMRWMMPFGYFEYPHVPRVLAESRGFPIGVRSVVLVGGGIAGLYAAYLIKKRLPGVKYTIIEKAPRCGGRVAMSKVGDVKVPTGAHFMRVDKDKTLGNLLRDLGFRIRPRLLEMDYTFEKPDPGRMISRLRSGMKKHDRSKSSFRDFGKKVLGDDYERLVDIMGYTDFEGADFVDTIENYGLDDNMPGYRIHDVDWDDLVERLVEEVGRGNIITNTEVKSIKGHGDGYIVNSKWKCDGVILATTVGQLRKLLDNPVYDGIQSQEFLKVFARVKGVAIENYTVVDCNLRKVVPIGGGVCTVAFADNEDAIELNKRDKSYFEGALSAQFKGDVKLSGVKKFFWEEGTHYYKPLSKRYKSRRQFIHEAQHPGANMWVVGEMVAEKQGWVEGALTSVEKISLFGSTTQSRESRLLLKNR